MEVTVNIIERLGAIGETNRRGFTRELNIVSWNGGKPKLDIRDWDGDHERMTRGIALWEDEARKLNELLTEYFKEAE